MAIAKFSYSKDFIMDKFNISHWQSRNKETNSVTLVCYLPTTTKLSSSFIEFICEEFIQRKGRSFRKDIQITQANLTGKKKINKKNVEKKYDKFENAIWEKRWKRKRTENWIEKTLKGKICVLYQIYSCQIFSSFFHFTFFTVI